MFQAVRRTLLVYQYTTALIKTSLFSPRALQATEPVSPCLSTAQDNRSLHRKQDGEQAVLLPVTEGQLIVLKTEVGEQVEESRKKRSQKGSGLSDSCTSWKPVRSPGHAVFLSLFHDFSVIQKSLLTELAFNARNQGVCEKLFIMAHEGTDVSMEGSKNGTGSSSPKNPPPINHKESWL